MRKSSKYHNDFEVNRLTNSILNCISGGSFPTDVLLLSKDDLKQILKKTGWRFNWKNEMAQPDREVYKLVITIDHSVLQGMV